MYILIIIHLYMDRHEQINVHIMLFHSTFVCVCVYVCVIHGYCDRGLD